MKKGCEMFQKCEDMIGKLGLFSSNETKEDISTNNLKYLLVNFYAIVFLLFGFLGVWLFSSFVISLV